jgi:hypothetical protein
MEIPPILGAQQKSFARNPKMEQSLRVRVSHRVTGDACGEPLQRLSVERSDAVGAKFLSSLRGHKVPRFERLPRLTKPQLLQSHLRLVSFAAATKSGRSCSFPAGDSMKGLGSPWSFALFSMAERMGPRPFASSFPLALVDPVYEISGAQQIAAGIRLATHHDGGQDLILGIASPSIHHAALSTAPRRAGAGFSRPPSVTTELNAVVFALRDAEVLVRGPIAPACIVHRHNAW